MRNFIEPNATARRAILTMAGHPDVRFELYRTSDFHFEYVANGKSGVVWRALTAEEAMRGSGRALTLDTAWEDCIARMFPGYLVTNLEQA